ncbi:polysaccharide pyruvyl transferase family protein [Novosphingobium guangzhouense]|uniref:polysaccharide pyruvyl transferase family protein n=1 Tax=Novosphingobium guangzhouense TaxID=1850347 RepID=UPI000CCC34F8|nr:polysaccharide pyruvyl transferase family protein [Novosphingobium guangzhouense]
MKLLHYRPSVPNFGDDLNAELWPTLAPDLFLDTGSDAASYEAAFVGIGTIVGIDPGQARVLHVFSSGAGYTDVNRWRSCHVDYHCVRGPVTARLLDLNADRVLTDGAILAPLLRRFRPRETDLQGGVAVVPHFETMDFPGWREAVQMAGFTLVDPRGTPESVIRCLAGARLVLTESLHGAIIADAFGVPWRGFAVSRNFSTAKWADWAASLDLKVDIALVPPPDPVQLFRFGRRAEPFGSLIQLREDTASQEFRHRIVSDPRAPFLKAQAKRVAEALPMVRRVLGYNAERTAQALTDVAALEPYCSSAVRRESLRDAMLSRLEALAVRAGISAAVAV